MGEVSLAAALEGFLWFTETSQLYSSNNNIFAKVQNVHIEMLY